jgi:capsular exopolysaccharide synthesis family protein
MPGPVNFLQDDDALSLPLEACRSVRTTLEFQDPDRKFKTLVVTSASAGEGKTSMLLNLGWVFWETGRRILLIDGDLRRPSLHQPLGIPNENWLAELLRERADWNEGRRAIREGLDFIPSGIEPSNPGPLLNSRFMTQVMTEARRHADIILIDSPPVLAVSDHLTLASLADGIVFVVRSGVTRRRNLLRAKARLEKVRARVLGVVVNGLSPRETRRYYAEYTSYVRVEPPARESRLGVLKRIARPRWPRRSTQEQNGEGAWTPGLDLPVEAPQRSLLKRILFPRWLGFGWLHPRWPWWRTQEPRGEGS